MSADKAIADPTTNTADLMAPRDPGLPEAALERMLRRWEPPDRTEAHRVEWVLT